jgi:hypothetical protein
LTPGSQTWAEGVAVGTANRSGAAPISVALRVMFGSEAVVGDPPLRGLSRARAPPTRQGDRNPPLGSCAGSDAVDTDVFSMSL